MPFVANTPESRLGRSDSRNPSSTCRGITSNGTACRRPVSPASKKGILDPGLPSSYCFQHKEQALRSHSSPGPVRPSILEEEQERDSLDTLAGRMGLVDLGGDGRKTDGANDGDDGGIFISKIICCCFTFDLGDSGAQLPPRPQPRPLQSRPSAVMPARLSNQQIHSAPAAFGNNQLSNHLQYVLPTTDADTASALTKELARPWVESEKPGYIYMFRMAPESESNPPIDAARSLFAAPPSMRDRRPGDVITSFADDSMPAGKTGKKMLLKIGRATNVQQRMNQWTRQCGYKIEVLRCYPYVPSASSASGSSDADAMPRMTPHCHRVERLIHLELAGMGLRYDADECKTCGKEHREWFEVDASRKGARVVDEVIRRWIRWDESLSTGWRARRS